MKIKRTFCLLITILILSYGGFSQDYHVRMAFMGNSITIGSGLSNPTSDAYPEQLSTMLSKIYGDTVIVQNFAVSGRTMLKKGDYPLWNEIQYPMSWNFAPDIVFILLGTNDTKPQNWGPYSNEYADDYQSMIDSFKVRNPRCKFISGFPPPCFETKDLSKVWLINDSIIINGVIPIVDSLAKANGAYIVDFYHALRDSGYLFPDAVHPNVAGHKIMAQLVLNKMVETDLIHQVETGYTYITAIKTNRKNIATGDSAIISWTTINADSVTFEGKKMDANGSAVIKPSETKVYTIYAYGQKSIDSMKITQNVYVPALTKMGISPRTANIEQYDSSTVTLSFYDQQSKAITNKSFNVEWTITAGGGNLINKTNTSATLVATEAGKTKVRAAVGDVFVEASFSIAEKVSSPNTLNGSNFRLYPNPSKDILNLEMEVKAKAPCEVIIYDLKGALCQKEIIPVSADGKQTFSIKTNKLSRGIYMLKVINGDLKYSEKFNKSN
jgi:acyl-CoA thioesterase I